MLSQPTWLLNSRASNPRSHLSCENAFTNVPGFFTGKIQSPYCEKLPGIISQISTKAYQGSLITHFIFSDVCRT